MKSTFFAIFVMVLTVLAAPAAAGQSAGEINVCKTSILQSNNLTEAEARQLPVGYMLQHNGTFYPLGPGQNPWSVCRDEIIPAESQQALHDQIAALEYENQELREENQELAQQVSDTNIVSSEIITQIIADLVSLDAQASSGGGNTNIVSSEIVSQIVADRFEINQSTTAAVEEVSTAPTEPPTSNLPILEWIAIAVLFMALVIGSVIFWRYREKMTDAMDRLNTKLNRSEVALKELHATLETVRECHGSLSEAHQRLHEDHMAAMSDNNRLMSENTLLRQKNTEHERIRTAHSSGAPMFELYFDEKYVDGDVQPITLIYDNTTSGGYARLQLAHGTKFLFKSHADLFRTLMTDSSLEILGHICPGLDINQLRTERKTFERRIGRLRTDKKAKTERIAKEWLNSMFRNTPSPRTFQFPLIVHPDFPANTIPDPVDLSLIKDLIPADAVMQ